jgi:hypothetical protein
MSTARETAAYFLTLEVRGWALLGLGAGAGALALDFFLGLSAKMLVSWDFFLVE